MLSHLLQIRCSGKFVTETSVWTTMVYIPCTSRPEKAVDGCGDPSEVRAQFVDGLTTQRPFVCLITRRNAERVQISKYYERAMPRKPFTTCMSQACRQSQRTVGGVKIWRQLSVTHFTD
ncbi:hypothetical protein EV702DRAFT_1143904 [Suillus placidus]|uniref:Uncharacterized protein n=1 Tax=Suillus placidus TaxID=48579 RepID=A0A9P7CXA9_9AGAM|nr:hypothetical protein EV702DRAFT_1143904 [Suillus placidus]